MFRTLRQRWKTWALAGTIAASGAITIAATDNFFEISKNLEIFNELFKELNIYYVDDTSPGELMTTAIDGMLESLDPYTQYIAESDMEDYRFQTTGQYGGIGALIRKRGDQVMISEPYEGYPAMKAGLWAGDEIIEVDGRKVAGMDTDEVSKLLKGQSGTSVKMVTLREGGSPVTLTLTREEIKIPDVPYKGIIDEVEQVGYLKLNSFTQTAGQEVRTAVKELKEKGAKKIIVDLRGNGGGLLREAVNIVNLFVPRNELVVETKGRISEWDKAYKTLGEPLDAEIPLVIVVDEHSASASEIVSGALQDLDRAVVVGERTYGKGLVQQTRDLYYNAKLKVTVAKYYIPSGRCIQKIDYAHRDSTGQAVEVDEKAIAEFHTRNGRPVTDGRGILPDVPVSEPEMPKVVGGLYASDIIFDYANKFRREHESIPPAKEFAITEEIYQDFLKYAQQHSFEYDTESVAKLNELVEVAKRERYYDHAKGAIDALKAELAPDRTESLLMFRTDIERVLRYEIVTRYYHQSGRMEAAIGTDPYLLKAIEVLGTGTWAGILKGTPKN